MYIYRGRSFPDASADLERSKSLNKRCFDPYSQSMEMHRSKRTVPGSTYTDRDEASKWKARRRTIEESVAYSEQHAETIN
jgi:hypothetical protein